MTTKGSQSTTNCSHCALAAENQALRDIIVTASSHIDVICSHCDRCLGEECEEWWTKQELAKMANPAPAVAALERRLAEANKTQTERDFLHEANRVLNKRLAPMPCGHPGACVVSSGDPDRSTNYCGWCEAEGQAETLAALVPETDTLERAASMCAILSGYYRMNHKSIMASGAVQMQDKLYALAVRIEAALAQKDSSG